MLMVRSASAMLYFLSLSTGNTAIDTLNDMSLAQRSTVYTKVAQEGSLRGSNAHDELERPPLPPFTAESALKKVKAAEDAWNSRDPKRVCMAYTPDTVWRNRDQIFVGRDAVVEFLTAKWEKELDYKLVKNLWCYESNRIAVRFTYEFRHAETGQVYRTHGNELWEFDDKGFMLHRDMSANDIPIDKSERLFL